jgi:hypothetical protein
VKGRRGAAARAVTELFGIIDERLGFRNTSITFTTFAWLAFARLI